MDFFLLGTMFLPWAYWGVVLGISHKANELFNRGELQRAIYFYNWSIRLHLDLTSRLLCRSNLMACYHALERYDEVEKEWLKICSHLKSLHPFAGLPAATRCAALVAQGRYVEAVQTTRLEQVVVPDIKRSGGTARMCESLRLTNQAVALIELGRFDEAELCLRQASELKITNQAVLQHRSLVKVLLLYHRGEFAEAQVILKGITLEGITPLYREHFALTKAKLLARTGMLEPAERLLGVVGVIDTNRLRMLRIEVLAALAEQRGDGESALRYYQQLLPARLPAAETYVRAANLALKLGKIRMGKQFLEAALEDDPESRWSEIARKRLAEVKT